MCIEARDAEGKFRMSIGGKIILRPGSRIVVADDGTILVSCIHIEPEPQERP